MSDPNSSDAKVIEEDSAKRLRQHDDGERCIACCHKICAGETLPSNAKVNVRPETCPRAKLVKNINPSAIGLYPKGSTVLTVGDGDLSFSLALAQFLGPENVVATTYESKESIIKSYPDSGQKNLGKLAKIKVPTFHGVDAMNLEATLDLDRRFDFVVFNFPCIATDIEGEDAQSQAMSENQQLLRLFGVGVRKFLASPSSQVHIAHKTKAAFKNWGVCKFVCMDSSLVPLRAMVFDRCLYPGYINRKARDKKSFPASDAVVFVFAQEIKEDESGVAECLIENQPVGAYLKACEQQSQFLIPCTQGVIVAVLEVLCS